MPKQKQDNLRGQRVTFEVGDARYTGRVQTRIRGAAWQIVCPRLPARFRRPDGSHRIVLDREDFEIAAPASPAARSPIERMIDDACGLSRARPGGDTHEQ